MTAAERQGSLPNAASATSASALLQRPPRRKASDNKTFREPLWLVGRFTIQSSSPSFSLLPCIPLPRRRNRCPARFSRYLPNQASISAGSRRLGRPLAVQHTIATACEHLCRRRSELSPYGADAQLPFIPVKCEPTGVAKEPLRPDSQFHVAAPPRHGVFAARRGQKKFQCAIATSCTHARWINVVDMPQFVDIRRLDGQRQFKRRDGRFGGKHPSIFAGRTVRVQLSIKNHRHWA